MEIGDTVIYINPYYALRHRKGIMVYITETDYYISPHSDVHMRKEDIVLCRMVLTEKTEKFW